MSIYRDEDKMMVIMDILQSKNTLEKVAKFRIYKDVISDCRIFLFNEKYSQFDTSFENKKIGQCGIFGIGDYTKTWILDSKHISGIDLVKVGKTISFDLNILTYLNKIMIGRKINIDKTEFINYLNYLKQTGFQIGIATALMERVRTPVNLGILSEMITSFVKFDNIQFVKGDFENIYLSSEDYLRIKNIYEIALEQANEILESFNCVCCCVMKAFLIKTYDSFSSKSENVDKFIEFCLNILNCYLEKEIVILSLYIMNDKRTHRTFKKLKNGPDIIKNILNVAWDIYHIRLLENIMLNDNMKNKDRVLLSYFGTADNGIIDAMRINPVKAYVIMNDCSIPIHQMNIEDVCKNKLILENVFMNKNLRSERIKEIDFSKIRRQLESEILEKANL